MQRDDAGSWTVTTPPAVPGFHYYWFVVDGLAVSDPASESFFGWGKETSGIEVPEKGADYYAVENVPHGDVRAFWYHSKSCDSWRRAMIYCPPTYERAAGVRFPVLYLQHGSGENETSWSNQGRMNFIMDNLLAAGSAAPMLVVMDCGYASRSGAPANPPATDAAAARVQGQRAFEEVVVSELIPAIDAAFRTIPDRDHRALAGLSMGSMQALAISTAHLDLFSHIGLFSGQPRGDFDVKSSFGGVFADAASFNARVKSFFVGIGTAEGKNYEAAQAFHTALEGGGITHRFFESPGTAHEWQTWRRCLKEFAPQLFK